MDGSQVFVQPRYVASSDFNVALLAEPFGGSPKTCACRMAIGTGVVHTLIEPDHGGHICTDKKIP